MSFHPEPLDHLPILSLIQRRGVNTASALYVSKLEIKGGIDHNGNFYINESYDRGTGYSINVENVQGFHSSNSFDNIGEELSTLANKLGRQNLVKQPKEGNVENLNLEKVEKLKIDITKDNDWSQNYRDEVQSFLREVDRLITGYRKSMRYSTELDLQFVQKRYQSTEGIDIQQEFVYSLLTLNSQSKNRAKPVKRNEIIGGIQKSDLSWDIIENKTSILADELEQLKVARKPKPGNYQVLLSADAVYSLIHETIGHGCEADQVTSKQSFLSDRIGFKVASSRLTIVDDPHIRNVGWSEYDDEGIKTQGTLLVDEGILSSYLHNKRTAQMMNQLSTGNARATSYFSPPEPRQSNIYIEPGNLSNEELLEDVKNGILIGPTLVASTSIYTGEFSIESQISYEIVDSEIRSVMGPVTLTGNALNTLNEVSAIGNHPDMIPTICLKDDSLVYVGSLMPQITLDNALIY